MALDYIYLRAWDYMMGSTSRWKQQQLEKARKANAPQNVVYETNGKWVTFDEVTHPDTRITIQRTVDMFTKHPEILP